MTLLAKLIAKEEGFFRSGTLPAIRHNPGDLRHAPHASHVTIDPNDIGIEDSDIDGWADLERQLRLYAGRGFTLRIAVFTWAPEADGNESEKYLSDLVAGFSEAGHPEVHPQTMLTYCLTINADS